MKFAICNEIFGPRQSLDGWRRLCDFLAECGYDGVEVAPFTFGDNVAEISISTRGELAKIANEAGLAIVSLHWLLVSPPGLHLHSKDDATRQRTEEYLKALIDFAGDLGAPLMVLGSHRQRHLEDGDYAGAWTRTRQTLGALGESLQARD